MPTLKEVQAELRFTIESLKGSDKDLRELLEFLPPEPPDEGEDEDDAPPDLASQLRTAFECARREHILRAIEILEEAARLEEEGSR